MTETTKGRLIQFLQGLRADLPELKVGQPAFCTDDFSFWIGSDSGNKRIAMYTDIGSSGGGGGGAISDGSITFEKLSPTLQYQINNFITLNDIPIASSTVNGSMSKEMYIKLDGIETQANKTVVVDNLTTVNSNSALSARQGKLINDRLTLVEGNGGGSSTLNPATSTVLGGIKVGSHLNVATDGKLDVKEASVSTLGVVRLNDTLNSTLTTQAATANSVKVLNDKIIASSVYMDRVDRAPTSNGLGSELIVSGRYSFAAGSLNTANGNYSTAFGSGSIASGELSVAYMDSAASGLRSFAAGNNTSATAQNSTSFGYYTKSNIFSSFVTGHYNKDLTGSTTGTSTNNDALVIGNGSVLTKSNAFRVRSDGSVYGLSAYNSSGADYAEYFEWLDGNLKNEDLVGYVVTLEGAKIRKANSNDDYILGVVSANPSVVGDSVQDQHHGMYEKDEFGRNKIEYTSENGEIVGNFIVSSKYDDSKIYVPREQRSEWDAVGLVGKLIVRQDGSAKVNSYVGVSGKVDGVVSHSNTRTEMRVMEVINNELIKVFIK